MKLRKNEVISPKNFFFLPRKSEFPRELFEKFLGENQNQSERVLFLKKVHSWEGITETVHGLFLLVL